MSFFRLLLRLDSFRRLTDSRRASLFFIIDQAHDGHLNEFAGGEVSRESELFNAGYQLRVDAEVERHSADFVFVPAVAACVGDAIFHANDSCAYFGMNQEFLWHFYKLRKNHLHL
jgi:hypothetical protein